MKRLTAIVAAVVVYAGVLGALEWKAYVARTPQGQVSITELTAADGASVIAQAPGGTTAL